MSDERSRRRWLPAFSVRTLLELVFVCAVLCYIWFTRPPGNVIQPEHLVQIDAIGTFADNPLRSDTYLVDPDGYVNLGANYGKFKVAGMTGDEAQAALLVHLKQWLISPRVTVSIAGWRSDADAMSPGDFNKKSTICGRNCGAPRRGKNLVETLDCFLAPRRARLPSSDRGSPCRSLRKCLAYSSTRLGR